MTMTHVQLREIFASFWKKHDHQEVPPISLVPKDDPTTLFTGSGMQQLVPYLLGEPHPLGKKLFNIQPCLRSQDIEKVGDNRHTTFFEMMGNWSLGTYFKKEQLSWFWEFLTKELKLPKEKLFVSVFGGTKEIPEDKESFEIWKSLGVPEERIFKYGPDNNWWSRAGEPKIMPAGEPGGPDSEVFYEFTQILHNPLFGKKCHPNCECGRFLEIGNSVFMEYKKAPNGAFLPLPNKNVDFGGGLERILAALNDDPDIFKTDVFWPVINKLQDITKKDYFENEKPMRIVVDHFKASTFLINNGVKVSNKGQGYVLRRLLRKATIKLFSLEKKINEHDVMAISQSVIETYKNIYFDGSSSKIINDEIASEISRFTMSLEKALPVLKSYIEKIRLKTGFLPMGKEAATIAFYFYQSNGLPIELFLDEMEREFTIAYAYGMKDIITEEFNKLLQNHSNKSRTSSSGMFKGGLADKSGQTIKYHTATHLIHQALWDMLGNEIKQEGSNITSERLRFDYYSPIKPTPEQIKQVETIVNEKIKQKLPVAFKMLAKEEANKLKARSFFKEKYPDMIKVYFIGDYSKEFCGGPHVKNTFEIGKLEIFKTEKIGSNLYRIYAK